MSNKLENLARNSPKTLQVLPKVIHKAHNPTNVSKASSPKVSQRWPRGSQKAPKRLQKVTKKQSKRHPETTPKPNPELETPFTPKCL